MSDGKKAELYAKLGVDPGEYGADKRNSDGVLYICQEVWQHHVSGRSHPDLRRLAAALKPQDLPIAVTTAETEAEGRELERRGFRSLKTIMADARS